MNRTVDVSIGSRTDLITHIDIQVSQLHVCQELVTGTVLVSSLQLSTFNEWGGLLEAFDLGSWYPGRQFLPLLELLGAVGGLRCLLGLPSGTVLVVLERLAKSLRWFHSDLNLSN